DLIIKGISVHI
nr:Chain A, TAR DNA-binding protein 43 [Homo sapiens]5W7V_0 Chain 0, TAR DNA-binding protein 43 [Homo sapiens]5W7V_1 Chain 1, TAR DNA-binding protein 43 [Homo sapiens]5W7V_2 Chain 2, TAR DNA-binding protein 43 [Homo sapiens]5W7V_3 Chain 3, TAR DNA-binding protein 43 [Homo sapiens]5W7V_4 Chain 4, TAR DNA-binding protein 43 [Homo sapiens]5W7V_5 Chain 5, TAR DNA-binding protein 43 [Homo sapiens]5W7V_6 Chain 6, TAR DNA-binding protein 43 [Homo sapiens]5W7V_7 Chain 7, TAR DNA-binding protein 43 